MIFLLVLFLDGLSDKTCADRFKVEDTPSDEEKKPGNEDLMKTENFNIVGHGISDDDFWVPIIKNEAMESIADEFNSSG